MDKRQISCAVKIWHCQACKRLVSPDQGWPGLGKNGGGVGREIFSGGTGPGGAWWDVGCRHASLAISVGQDHLGRESIRDQVPSS